jgi:hypothetical protein
MIGAITGDIVRLRIEFENSWITGLDFDIISIVTRVILFVNEMRKGNG